VIQNSILDIFNIYKFNGIQKSKEEGKGAIAPKPHHHIDGVICFSAAAAFSPPFLPFSPIKTLFTCFVLIRSVFKGKIKGKFLLKMMKN
jgi:hypothetical protein